jgi:copper chaperone CopZ
MDRRWLLGRIVGATAGLGVAAAAGVAVRSPHILSSVEDHALIYSVDGFTCVTCAVGLETMLRKAKGVTSAHTSYPERTVSIGFDSRLTSQLELKEMIESFGFKVFPVKPPQS